MKIQKFILEGITCSSCVNNINNHLSKLEGVDNFNINIIDNSLLIKYNENILSEIEILNTIKNLGYGIEDFYKISKDNSKKYSRYKLKVYISLILSFIIMYISMGDMINLYIPSFLYNNSIIFQILFLLPIIILNYKYYTNGFKKIYLNIPNMESLIAISTSAALLYSFYSIYNKNFSNIYFESIAMIISFISLGKYIEDKIKNKASETMKKLLEMTPKVAVVYKDRKEILTDIKNVEIGDEILVKSGEIIPLDGILVRGNALVDESLITGESIYIEKKIGDNLIGNTINKKGYFALRVTKKDDDGIFSKIVQLVNNAMNSKILLTKIADKISSIFVKVIICISIVTFLIWLLINKDFNYALLRAIAVLVISCPCALGLATPLSIMMGSYLSSKHGILFKTSQSLSLLKEANLIIFDKTGTLTYGNIELENIDYLENEKKEILEYIYSGEEKSSHPLATPLKKYCKDNNVNLLNIDNFLEIDGQGLRYTFKGKEILIGNEKMMLNNLIDISFLENKYIEKSKKGNIVLFLAENKKVVSLISLSDKIRYEAKEVINKLKKSGYKIMMLTGDNKYSSKTIAKNLGIDNYNYQLLPEDKYNIINEKKKNNKVIMVGDGINDAPSLVLADVGISIGNASDIAIEAADIILLKNDLTDILKSINLANIIINNIKLNLFWAFIYNIIGISLATGFFYFDLSPMFAAFAMSLSSISVLLNSLFLKFKKIDM